MNDATVKEALTKGELYNKGRIIAARVKKINRVPVHVEYRVLEQMETLININHDYDHDLLLFFVLGFKCDVKMKTMPKTFSMFRSH